MFRKVVLTLIVLAAVLAAGCAGSPAGTSPPAPGSFSMLRKGNLESKWEYNHINLEVQPSGEMSLLVVELAEGEKVDGFFTTQNGENIGFAISGNSTIHQSIPDSAGKSNSGRFSFTTTRDQGNTYTLKFENTSGKKVNVFLEVIFPSTASIFVPVAIK